MTARAEKTKKSTSPKSGASKKPVAPSKRKATGKATPKTEPKRGQGRPTKYEGEKTDKLAFKLCLLGATEQEIANALEVSLDTVTEWKRVHPSFSASINEGRETADATIAESLYNRAKGYSHPDVHISSYEGGITVTPITKHYPPDTAAAFIWLKNRKSGKWRDKVEVTHSIETLSDEDLDKLIEQKRALIDGSQAPK